jgi:hypothetical protein
MSKKSRREKEAGMIEGCQYGRLPEEEVYAFQPSPRLKRRVVFGIIGGAFFWYLLLRYLVFG